ncbi:hypothetical protein EVAR_16921_1 [Eumeta japonica]|uniref:Uncharacterized protein n=1 Tax=Eumeta variegata TaxID=151549 RepID=A0A4C1TVP4_EUMVA|nr:hypothetical protein EVAR_16921_1 [Eumeta japonica]
MTPAACAYSAAEYRSEPKWHFRVASNSADEIAAKPPRRGRGGRRSEQGRCGISLRLRKYIIGNKWELLCSWKLGNRLANRRSRFSKRKNRFETEIATRRAGLSIARADKRTGPSIEGPNSGIYPGFGLNENVSIPETVYQLKRKVTNGRKQRPWPPSVRYSNLKLKVPSRREGLMESGRERGRFSIFFHDAKDSRHSASWARGTKEGFLGRRRRVGAGGGRYGALGWLISAPALVTGRPRITGRRAGDRFFVIPAILRCNDP